MRDSFDPITVTPTKRLDKLQAVFTVTPGDPNKYEALYTFHILNDEGLVLEPRSGDLTAHAQGWNLTAGQKNALGNCTTVAQAQKLLIDYYLAKAQGALE